MELPSQEGEEMPVPLNSTYGGAHGHGHMIHHDHHHHHPSHNHIIPSSTAPPPPPQIIPSNGPLENHEHIPFKKMVKYRECLKNHAAAMGGNATDGCGEFMPSGEEGSIEALTCSACNCHRNFHRKEIEGEPTFENSYYHHPRMGRKLFLGHNHKYLAGGPEAIGYHAAGALISSRALPPHQMIMSYNMGSLPSESDEQEEAAAGGGGGVVARPPQMKKRFRTKFTQEQKEKMLSFAEKVGWKIQKQEEAVVQQFCQEVGVKRRVLKVWMHNNKHNLAKKISSNHLQPSVNPPQSQV